MPSPECPLSMVDTIRLSHHAAGRSGRTLTSGMVLTYKVLVSIGIQKGLCRRFGAVELLRRYILAVFYGGCRCRHGFRDEIFCLQGLRPIRLSLMAIRSASTPALRSPRPPVRAVALFHTMSTVGIGAGQPTFQRTGEPWSSSCGSAAFAAVLHVVPPRSSPSGSRPASPSHI